MQRTCLIHEVVRRVNGLSRVEIEGLEEGELLLWALQCIVDFAGAVASLVEEDVGTSDPAFVVPR